MPNIPNQYGNPQKRFGIILIITTSPKKKGGPQTYISTKGVWSKIDYPNFPPKKKQVDRKNISSR